MAKSSGSKASGSSRIRFIMVEAEMSDGDLTQITQAIQSALRGPVVASQKIISTPSLPRANGEAGVEEDADEDLNGDDSLIEVPSKPTKARGPRKPAPTPDVLDVDLISETSLASFAARANPESDRKRFLVIAAWFKEHRQISAITPSHIYTGYRALKWSTAINDFAQPLRNLKADKLMTSPERGSYAINHLGIAQVTEMLGDG